MLAAFSALAVAPTPREGSAPAEPPELPAPYDIHWASDRDPVSGEDWEPTDELFDPAADPEPWRHRWAAWLSSSMSVSITPSAQMTWSEVGRWTVGCRWGVKSPPETIIPALRWLGRYREAFDQRPILLGYIDYGSEPQPTLVWLTPDGDIQGEDLNGPR